jgi:hypothetical protein
MSVFSWENCRLSNQVARSNIDEPRLAEIESQDCIFPVNVLRPSTGTVLLSGMCKGKGSERG